MTVKTKNNPKEEKTTTKNTKKEIRDYLKNDIKVHAKNESQKKLIQSIKNNTITICGGKSGTGKTYVVLGMALNLLRKTTNNFEKIYFVKSATPLKGENLGYLKGNLEEKIHPFMMSYYLNLEKLIQKNKIPAMVKDDIIRPSALTYLRGVTIDRAIVVLDEAQNVNVDNMKTLMTRIGEDSILIIMGDTNQIDITHKTQSALECLIKYFDGIDDIGVVMMDDDNENLRNPIIKIIEEKFKEIENGKK